MTSDRTVLLFRVRCTLFCLLYSALLFFSVVYFRHRLAFITDALGTGAPLPALLTFARSMHQPWILAVAALAPCALVTLVWITRPNAVTVVAESVLMVLLVLLVLIPPVATEMTTSSILKVMHKRATELGLIQ